MRVFLILIFILLPGLCLGQEADESPPAYNDKPYRNLFAPSELALIEPPDLSVNPDFFEKNSSQNKKVKSEKNINYGKLIAQTHLAIGIQDSIRLFEPKTRSALKGPFFRDWFRSVNNLRGWSDGDSFSINWVRHPIQGSASAFIFAQNHKQSKNTRFGDKGYWNTKGRQLLFVIIYSEYFEIGPISEASIGNIGLRSGAHGYIDHVTTPITGTLLSIIEDIADKYVIDKVRRRSRCLADVVSIFLNPGRTSANFVAFHRPAYRPFNRD